MNPTPRQNVAVVFILVLAFAFALTSTGGTISELAWAQRREAYTWQELQAMPALPGSIFFQGNWNSLDSKDVLTIDEQDVPRALSALVDLVTSNDDSPRSFTYEVWQASEITDGIAIELFVLDGEQALVQPFAFRVRADEDNPADSFASVRLFSAEATLQGAAGLAGLTSVGDLGAVALFTTEKPGGSTPLWTPEDRVTVEIDGENYELSSTRLNAGDLGGLVKDDRTEDDGWILGVATKLWNADLALDLAASLADALQGDGELARIVASGEADRAEAAPGDRIRYVLKMGNVGAAAATDIATNLPIPAQIEFDADSLSVNVGSVVWEEDQLALWRIDEVPVGFVAELSYEGTVR